MKKTLITIIIAFSSGITGSWFFQKYGQSDSKTTSQDVNLITNHDAEQSARKSFFGDEVANNIISTKSELEENDIPANINFVKASRVSTASVVYIKTLSQNSYGNTWMDWFFGGGTTQSISSGSGVIYSADGFIITNNHVIDQADQIEVILGKKTYSASIIGTDPASDLAVLKIEEKNLPNIQVSTSQDVQIGDWVLAVGNPFNLTSTVTAGIVSAKGRELHISNEMFPIESFIQTDAAINPGNSGGALVNLDGQLIGINTAILSKTGSYAGYGFAVPSDIVKKVVDDIIKYGEVQKAFFGAEVTDINSEVAAQLNTEDFSGVVISRIQSDGAAAKIDLRKDDIILKFDNAVIDSRSQFEEILSYKSPGDKVSVVFKRNQKIISNTITLTNKEGTTEILKRQVFTSRSLGAEFEKISKVERDRLQTEQGVRITKVYQGLIAQMGLSEGFIITYINKVPITDPETLADILTKIRGRVYLEGINKQGRKEMYRYYF
jgi:Do/DeqQ family serine protease